MYANFKGAEVGQLFSMKIALNVHVKGLLIPKNSYQIEKWKIWNILVVSASFNFSAINDRRRRVTRP